jgi:hypothetical protein
MGNSRPNSLNKGRGKFKIFHKLLLHNFLYFLGQMRNQTPLTMHLICELCWNFETIYGGSRVRNRTGIRLSYWPRQHCSLAEFVPWNRFLGSGHLSFKIRALYLVKLSYFLLVMEAGPCFPLAGRICYLNPIYVAYLVTDQSYSKVHGGQHTLGRKKIKIKIFDHRPILRSFRLGRPASSN